MGRKNADIQILVFNCGSSSLKYRLIAMPQEKEILAGEAQRVGVKTSAKGVIEHTLYGKKRTREADLPDHLTAFRAVMEMIKSDCAVSGDIHISHYAHRYVHPGNSFDKPALITKKNLGLLADTRMFAPIHNPVSYALVEACFKEYSHIPQYVVFDTAFHVNIPKELSSYALPAQIARKYNIRKVGFHGISHKYVMQEACAYLGRKVETQKIVSCHLGSGGSSLCAIRQGRSINNSMGFTPLDGLVMNTRSGSIDIGILLYLMFYERLSADDAEKMLNKKSGILGISSESSDIRDLVKKINREAKAKMAVAMYVRRVKKALGFYALLLQKPDIVIFTDTLGVEVSYLRRKICEHMDTFGIALSEKKNIYSRGRVREISLAGSSVKILVIKTDEEVMIAREAYERIAGR